MKPTLVGKHIFISGSTNGIGLGIASAFLAEKAIVTISGRTKARLVTAKDQLEYNNPNSKVFTIQSDLTKAASLRKVKTKLEKYWKGFDVLVLNLGSGRGMPPEKCDEKEWLRMLHLNLISSAETLRVLIPLLSRGSKPNVVFIGSIAGLESLGAPIPYEAAKAGIIQVMKEYSRYLAPAGIRVNMVAPGNIFFPNGTWDKKMKKDKKHVKSYINKAVPMKRFGTVEEVANAVIFLASENASFITGTCLVVDGGQTLAH